MWYRGAIRAPATRGRKRCTRVGNNRDEGGNESGNDGNNRERGEDKDGGERLRLGLGAYEVVIEGVGGRETREGGTTPTIIVTSRGGAEPRDGRRWI